MKRILFAWGILAAVSVMGAPRILPAEAKGVALAKLVAEFPRHMAAGGNLDEMHPVARECFEEFVEDVGQLTVRDLPRQAVRLARSVEIEISLNSRAASANDNPFGSRGRTAAQQNVRWLEQKVKPWLKRLAEVSRAKN
jgi:hypothetical protein